MVFGFAVRCSPDLFGLDCTTRCVEIDNESAHLGCDEETGEFVCLPGFQNMTSNCTDCALAEGCCKFVYK